MLYAYTGRKEHIHVERERWGKEERTEKKETTEVMEPNGHTTLEQV